MPRIPKVLILASSGDWIELDNSERPSGWHEWWSDAAVPARDFQLVVAPPAVPLEEIKQWRASAPEVDVLVVTQEGNRRLSEFFGDQSVFFLHPPSSLGELRAAVQEVLSYRDACRQIVEDGRTPPPVEELTPVEGWLELTGPSHPVFLRRFRNWLEILDTLPIEGAELQRVTHAVREVGWNAIEWGNRFDPERRLTLSFLALDDSILFRVQDEGSGSDWYTDPGRIGTPEEIQRARAERGIRPGGLGLALVESIVDRLEVSDHGNIVILEKSISKSGGDADDDASTLSEGTSTEEGVR